MAFSSCQLIAGAALSGPAGTVLAGGGLLWMLGETVYAFCSATSLDKDDFGRIARRNPLHLGIASTALISTCAAGVFAAFQFL